MANTKSAKKQILINERNRVRNLHYRTRMKNIVKRTKLAILDPEVADMDAKKAVLEAQSVLHSTAGRGIIHGNTASRKVSRLVRLYRKTRVPGATPLAAKEAEKPAAPVEPVISQPVAASVEPDVVPSEAGDIVGEHA